MKPINKRLMLGIERKQCWDWRKDIYVDVSLASVQHKLENRLFLMTCRLLGAIRTKCWIEEVSK